MKKIMEEDLWEDERWDGKTSAGLFCATEYKMIEESSKRQEYLEVKYWRRPGPMLLGQPGTLQQVISAYEKQNSSQRRTTPEDYQASALSSVNIYR